MEKESATRLKCPTCGAIGKGKTSLLDRDIKCPKCGNMVRMASLNMDSRDANSVVHAGPQEKIHPNHAESLDNSIAAHESNTTFVQHFDVQGKVALWIGGGGLLFLGLSPLFKWVNIAAGGITGISGDGKVILGITFLATAIYLTGIITGKRLTTIFLGVQSWGTLAVFWMGGLIWKVSSILDIADMKGNPFAALFVSQISPGTGLYLGLIGGLAVAGALGFLVVRLLSLAGNLKPFYATQGVSCAFGFLLALSVSTVGSLDAPETGIESTPTIFGMIGDDANSASAFTDEGRSVPKVAKPTIRGVELAATLVDKRFDKQNYQEFIWLDINWTAKQVKKPVRAVKGILTIVDLFGENKFILEWTINRPVKRGDQFMEEGIGFKYNQFMDSHRWVLTTEKENMRLVFVPESVMYSDGTVESNTKTALQNSILTPNLLAKRFDEQNYQEFVWVDIEWDTSRLQKPTRAVKGVLHFTDLFGDPKLSINTTIDDPLQPGESFMEEGIGFKYNQFMDSHRWVLTTEKENMRLVFVPESIIYSDGTVENM